MIYFYSPSLNTTVYAMNRWPIRDICIVTYNEALLAFCNNIHCKNIKIKSNTDVSFKGIKKHKKYLKNLTKNFHQQTFVFSHYSFDYWGLFFLKLLAKKNYVEFTQISKFHHSKKIFPINYKYVRFLFDNSIIFFFTGIWYNCFVFNKRYIRGLSQRKISMIFKQSNQKQNNLVAIENRKRILHYYKLSLPKIILIEQGELFYKYPSSILNELIKIAKNCHNFFLKEHPVFKTKNKKLIQHLSNLPHEIPIETICDNNVIFIGIASEALKQHEKSISLIQLVEIDNHSKSNYIEFLSDSIIEYPKTINELYKLLAKFIK